MAAHNPRYLVTIATGWACLSSTISSAILTGSEAAIAHRFNVTTEVAIIATSSLYILGYFVGPFVWSPMSQTYGRKGAMVVAAFGFIVFGCGTAVAKDFQTLAICRFFQGAMGAASVSLNIPVLADMFKDLRLGVTMTFLGTTVFLGPVCIPFISGFTLTNPSLGWRWCAWWTVFLGIPGLIGLLLMRESYAPLILRRKAAALRYSTGNYALHARSEESPLLGNNFFDLLLKRPIQMIIQEPILLLVSLYTGFIYALLYTFLLSYGLVFVDGYHMTPGVAGLTFYGVAAGMLLAMGVFINQQRYFICWKTANNGKFVPEWRMPLCMTGAVAFPAGLFWFGWTADAPDYIHWIVPTLSGILTGYGFLMIFYCTFTYLLDVYLQK